MKKRKPILYVSLFFIVLLVLFIDAQLNQPVLAKSMQKPPSLTGDSTLISRLETYNIETGERKIIYETQNHIEAPNWSKDGRYFLFNSQGHLFTLPIKGGTPKKLNTGFANHCNNDHGFSPDGKQIALSNSPEGEGSQIYILPTAGGTPKQITKNAPSYWHGWSPDGKTLVYPGKRNGDFNIYAISTDGGKEKKLTDAKGLDDGPGFSPDGKWIYFNSVRTGVMKIYRMRPDGSKEQQLTDNHQYADWFPHVSPDGQWMVFLSYKSSVEGHPPNKQVVLRLMSPTGGSPKILTKLYGGQGTINVPSWSPDSKKFAFVSYQYVKK